MFGAKNVSVTVRQTIRACSIRKTSFKTRQTAIFLQRKKSIHRDLANDLTCAALKTTFRTRKSLHNKQYPTTSKDKQSSVTGCTHFDVRFNNCNVAMHRPTIIFLLPHKITPVQQNKQSDQSTAKSITQTITTNNHNN